MGGVRSILPTQIVPMHEITARKASVRDIYFTIVELRSGRSLVNDKTALSGDVIHTLNNLRRAQS